jgi:ubiquinone/menaquinone biosynthesis C-methylase UbiE
VNEQENLMDNHDRGQVAPAAAVVYERFFVPALFAAWPPHLLQRAGVQAGERVLDVACGTGVLARAAAQRVGTQGTVVGVDSNPGMLAVGRQKAADVGRQKAADVVWQVSPAESLPFPDCSFDRVLSQFGLMFFDDPVRALTEMRRVLRPGGTLAVAVWGELSATPGYAAMAALLDELFGREIAKSIEVPYVLGDQEALRSRFARAGMEDVVIETVVGQARFASLDDWMYTDIKGWTLADVIDDAAYARLCRYAPHRLARFINRDGSVTFDAPAHIASVRLSP